jgi:hypothetical protein
MNWIFKKDCFGKTKGRNGPFFVGWNIRVILRHIFAPILGSSLTPLTSAKVLKIKLCI